jgi:hypothetical protein
MKGLEVEVVGWNWAQNPGKLQKGIKVSLALEPENKFDSNAVKVFITDSMKYVGRIPGTHSAIVAEILRSYASGKISVEAISRNAIMITL